MKKYRCDSCHAEVNDYGHWYDGKKPRNMYELKCIHESNEDTCEGMIFCQECIAKLIYKESKEESVLYKIEAELIQLMQNRVLKIEDGCQSLWNVIDKYKSEEEK